MLYVSGFIQRVNLVKGSNKFRKAIARRDNINKFEGGL
jgi:hypothetical protein